MALSFCGKRVLAKNLLTAAATSSAASTPSHRHNGYIVLLPEIGEYLPDKNPLLHHDGLPEFSNITIEKCMGIIAKQTIDFESCVKDIEQKLSSDNTNNTNKNVFDRVFRPLEEIGVPLDMTWGLSKTLYLGNSTLMPTKSYLAIHDRAKRARSTKFSNSSIYREAKRALSLENNCWTDEQVRILRKFVLEGKLNGLELDVRAKSRLEQHLMKLAIEKSKFQQKIAMATNHFSHTITDADSVRDFPDDLLKVISAQSPQQDGRNQQWTINLHPTCYRTVMARCPDRAIRRNVWQAKVSRGSGYGHADLSTGLHLEEIRSMRRDIARTLGYRTFADMSMETKMAGTVDGVQTMLSTLLERARPAQDRELEQLHAFALQNGFTDDRLQLWDVSYWGRRQQLFNNNNNCSDSDFDYKQYFPLSKVLEGLFNLSEKLFKITIKQRNNVSAWHKDVKYYDIFETHDSAPVAGFYLDPYARRDEKVRFPQQSGWMVGIQNQSRIVDTKPLAALIFNFDPTSDTTMKTKEPKSYLSFDEVKSLFHKFGHSLQYLLSNKTNYSEVSGTSNIEWDAVELSGHVFTHLLLEKNTIDSISSHQQTNEKLPPQMRDNLLNAHKHLAGTTLCRELYLSALDLELHSDSNDYWLDVVKRLWPEYHAFPLDKLDSHPCSFTDVFTEEWGAAYYCRVWSRMIAADVYSAFQVDDRDRVGKRFRDTFLALGGSCHPKTVFRQFRGRDPSTKALLTALGLDDDKEEIGGNTNKIEEPIVSNLI